MEFSGCRRVGNVVFWCSFSYGPRDRKFGRFIFREFYIPFKVEGGSSVEQEQVEVFFLFAWLPCDIFTTTLDPIFHIEIYNPTHSRRLPSSRRLFSWIFYFGHLYLGSLYSIGRWCTLGQIVQPAGFSNFFRALQTKAMTPEMTGIPGDYPKSWT